MTRTIKIAKGLSAFILLAVLLVAVPWALWHYVGWPLPHGLPSWSQFTTALNQHGIPDQVLLKALACVVWISWAILATSVLVEVPAAVRGRAARRLAVTGPLQPLVGHLVAAILVATLAVLPRPDGQQPVTPLGQPFLRSTTGTGCRDGVGERRHARSCAIYRYRRHARGEHRHDHLRRPTRRHPLGHCRTPTRRPTAVAGHLRAQRRPYRASRPDVHRPPLDLPRLDP